MVEAVMDTATVTDSIEDMLSRHIQRDPRRMPRKESTVEQVNSGIGTSPVNDRCTQANNGDRIEEDFNTHTEEGHMAPTKTSPLERRSSKRNVVTPTRKRARSKSRLKTTHKQQIE